MASQNKINPPATPKQQYANARMNLGLMILFTIVNISLLFAQADVMFLFSATIPYFTGALGVAVMQEYGLSDPSVSAVFAIYVAITVVAVLLYALCWWLSKKHVGWMIAALVLFVIDSVFMLYMYFVLLQDYSCVLDIVCHAWVLYYLIVGVINGHKKTVVTDEPAPAAEMPAEVQETASAPSSAERYPADETVKARILAETEFAGLHIVYRRVKRVNELVINGYVYDTYEALLEQPHTLRANVNGTVIEAGLTVAPRSFIAVNGETLVKKLRLV